MWEKISAYFSTRRIIAGLSIALAGSLFLYLAWVEESHPWLEIPAALLFLWGLLRSGKRIWFWSGFFLGLLWFWWIGLSFRHYGHPWAVPFVDLAVALVYGLLFWLLAWTAERIASIFHLPSSIPLKALAIWALSGIHPFGFDWFKPELTLVHTPFGVDKVHFALLLTTLLLVETALCLRSGQKLEKAALLFSALGSLFLALSPEKVATVVAESDGPILLAGTKIPIEKKWDPRYLRKEIDSVMDRIDRAICREKRVIVLPESVLPIFLNRNPRILEALKERSRKIDIVIGALYYDKKHKENRNSAYHFRGGSFTVADKVVLVPFGEANPLPRWAGRILNRIFFDGAPDYRPARKPTDFTIDGKTFRSAVCYEGTSERLYTDHPKRIVMLSNNGWFTPSIEPTLQRLLLEYYARKYGTTIYHSVNMSDSYVIRPTRPHRL